jgi:type VI secretion system protein ImpH
VAALAGASGHGAADMSEAQALTLGDRLQMQAPRFALLPAMALLEHFGRLAGAPAFGGEAAPGEAAARLTTRASFGFPPSEVDHVRLAAAQDDTRGQAELRSLGTGLLGHFGPLPDWVTEQLVQRARRGDHAAIAFLAMFEQRLQALAFRAQSRLWPGIGFRTPEESSLGHILHAVIGLGTAGLRGRMDVPDRAVLGFAGLLAGHTRSLGALERMLQSHLGLKVRAVPFTGRWLALEPEDIMQVGTKKGANNLLGRTALLGARIWDRQSCFTLQIGPLDPRLRPERIETLRISAGAKAARLGWTSFLIGRPDTASAGAIRLAVRPGAERAA